MSVFATNPIEATTTTIETSSNSYKSTPPPRNLIKILSDLEVLTICEFLTPKELFAVTETCKSFHSASLVGDLWLKFIPPLWESRKLNCPHHRPTPTSSLIPSLLLNRIRALPLHEVRRALDRVDIRGCREKVEFHLLLQAWLLFGINRKYSTEGQKVPPYPIPHT